MSLYGNFTLKDWLSVNCTTKDVDDLLRRALRNNDEPLAVLCITELAKRGESALVASDIVNASRLDLLVHNSHFSVVMTNTLAHCREPMLKRCSQYVKANHAWPKTTEELLDGSDLADFEHAVSIPMASETTSRFDERLERFLDSFMREGWFSVEFGFFHSDTEWDPHSHETIPINSGEHCNLAIKDGFILNGDEIPNIASILDAEGIADPLPAFNGKELALYTLDENGNWASPKDAKEDFFYVTYYSVK